MLATSSFRTVDARMISELKIQMLSFTTRFDKYIAAGRELITREREEHIEALAEDDIDKQTIAHSIQSVKQERESLSATRELEALEVVEMETSIVEYESKLSTLVDAKCTLQKRLDEMQTALAQKYEKIKQHRIEQLLQNEVNHSQTHLYEAQLGLRFKAVGTRIWKFMFEHLSATNPGASCSITLCLSPDYQVRECDPMLPSLDTLIARLNRHRIPHLFLKEIREEFCRKLQQEQASN